MPSTVAFVLLFSLWHVAIGQYQIPIPYRQQPLIHQQPLIQQQQVYNPFNFYQQPQQQQQQFLPSYWNPYLIPNQQHQQQQQQQQQQVPVSIIDVDDGWNNKNPTPMAVQDPYANIPTEIIDENAIMPEVYVPIVDGGFNHGNQAEESVVIVTQKPVITQGVIKVQESTYNSSTSNEPKSYHLVEHKPIQSIIRRVITSNGRDANKIINIHLVNGVEVTTTPEPPSETSAVVTKQEAESNEESSAEEDDGEDPKPVLSWFG